MIYQELKQALNFVKANLHAKKVYMQHATAAKNLLPNEYKQRNSEKIVNLLEVIEELSNILIECKAISASH